ncbi:hypothetical protein RM697_05740 [Ichthyenterobacterium sp. W332]|uniref:PepSY-like beta-lactamase-inhibitor n=1 Tax=Microcosmobacter mediterraneus TaxID=3075607 RepID=A0ABU2YJZ1_9FLAO|nr:hypothetical protein [Ichthyenterobacterium sp. W332]MDT0558137.1 hypothetical protein [Ichthyenterobacterium sp. W332]
MNLKLFFITLVLLCAFQNSFGQSKNEKEERIKISEFPKKAIQTIKTLPDTCKRLKFYKETDNEKLSYEIKFKYNNIHYSLEFSEDGIIEDIELTTKFKRINKTSQNKIKSYLTSSFSKHKIIKIQKQYLYTTKNNAPEFLLNVLSQNITIAPNFEIIIDVKSNRKRSLVEATFNNSGELISYRTLKPSSYEHVLY